MSVSPAPGPGLSMLTTEQIQHYTTRLVVDAGSAFGGFVPSGPLQCENILILVIRLGLVVIWRLMYQRRSKHVQTNGPREAPRWLVRLGAARG